MPNFTGKINQEEFEKKVEQAIDLILFSEEIDDSQPRLFASSSFEESKKAAEEIAEKKDIREIICSCLKEGANDSYEIAKLITPILLPLIIAETIVMPASILIFAWLAILISKSGVAGFCKDIE